MRTQQARFSVVGVSTRRLWFVLLVAGAAVGCSEKSNLVSIAGKVTYKQKPIPSSALTFFPSNGRPVIASVLADGSYSCELPPGEYRATIDIGRSLPSGWKEGDPVPPPPIVLPAIYSSRVNTPLTATVAADQSAAIDFELK